MTIDTEGLKIVDWALPIHGATWGGDELLAIDTDARSTPMAHTEATADPLVTNGALGVDFVRVPAGGGFAPHTHPGDHLLIIVAGFGTVTLDGVIYPTGPGQVYLVPGQHPHAVGAITDHCILAVGSPHKACDAPDRMTLVDYAAVTAELGRLQCRVCGIVGTPDQLRSMGCSHPPAVAVPEIVTP